VLGIVQKIFYFHVAAAFAMLLSLVCGAVFSLTDLVAASDRVDAVARACVEAGVIFGAMVLTSGPIWARKSWGMYWTWEPRLTLTLLVCLLAVSVVLVRALTAENQLGRRIGAAMAVMAAPAAYLIHVAVDLWGGNHPVVLEGGGIQNVEMRVTFWVTVAAMLAFAGLVVATRYRGLRLEQRLDGLRLALSARAILEARANA
jgi:heme exporter protein C